MADTKTSALAAGTTPDGTEKIPAVQGGATVSLTVNQIKGFTSGTSFPGSPASGDRYYRTDRNIDYVYDGTRWLSTQIFVQAVDAQPSFNPMTASAFCRAAHPWAGVYDIYVERFSVSSILSTGTTSSNYFTFQLGYGDGLAADTNIGSALSSQGTTQNANVALSNAPNVVVPSSADTFGVLMLEAGTASGSHASTFTYRLVG